MSQDRHQKAPGFVRPASLAPPGGLQTHHLPAADRGELFSVPESFARNEFLPSGRGCAWFQDVALCCTPKRFFPTSRCCGRSSLPPGLILGHRVLRLGPRNHSRIPQYAAERPRGFSRLSRAHGFCRSSIPWNVVGQPCGHILGGGRSSGLSALPRCSGLKPRLRPSRYNYNQTI